MRSSLILLTLLFFHLNSLATEAGLCLQCQEICLPEISIDLNPKSVCKISQLAINNLKKEITDAILDEGELEEQEFKNIPFPKINPENGDIVISKNNKANVTLKDTKIEDIEIEIKSTKCENSQIEVTVVLNKLKVKTKIFATTTDNTAIFSGIDAVLSNDQGNHPSEFNFKAKINAEKGLGDFISIDENSGKSNLKTKRIKVYLNDGDGFSKTLTTALTHKMPQLLNLKPFCPSDLSKEIIRTQYLRLKTFQSISEKCQTENQISALKKLKENPKDALTVILTSDLYHHPEVSEILNSGLDIIAKEHGFQSRGNLTSLITLQFLTNELTKNEEFVDFLNPLTSEVLKPVAEATNRGLKRLPNAITKGLQQVPAFNLNSGNVDGSVSYDELFAVLQQGQRGTMMNLYKKKTCQKEDLNFVNSKNSNSDFSVNFSLKAIESYFDKIKSKGFLKICTGSDDEVKCQGGRWLEVKETPQLRFDNGKLKMKVKHNVSVGDFETEFDLNLEKCENTYCFKLQNPNTKVTSKGLIGFALKTFKINNIIDGKFSEKFDIVNEKATNKGIPLQISNAKIDPKEQRIEIDFNFKD